MSATLRCFGTTPNTVPGSTAELSHMNLHLVQTIIYPHPRVPRNASGGERRIHRSSPAGRLKFANFPAAGEKRLEIPPAYSSESTQGCNTINEQNGDAGDGIATTGTTSSMVLVCSLNFRYLILGL